MAGKFVFRLSALNERWLDAKNSKQWFDIFGYSWF